jgi:hypothetical protein
MKFTVVQAMNNAVIATPGGSGIPWIHVDIKAAQGTLTKQTNAEPPIVG